MSSFLIVYNRRSGHVKMRRFDGKSAAREALLERFRLEKSIEDPDVEVVALNSDSEETVRKTHSRYFQRENLDAA
ncbi:hypothetical protein [Gulosibacter chungangensis]|uniref:Uncharacterized protein n=1 Tax=Gulosibacter chungangensis TaxID=979746 RepID=A0A7J5B7B1_9MICO|nr:hypothetical protein [Gulosibacter chungangensis]KAB1640571.1 hypothetical protein F8O05_14490 [Gulosibacter chungangensis]